METTSMRMAAIFSGLALSLTASLALACPQPDRCGGDRYGPEPAYDDDGGYDVDDRGGDDDAGPAAYEPGPPAVWDDGEGLYMYGHRAAGCDCREAPPPPPCDCRAGGLVLGSSFFDGSGGVGPIPDGGYYGGGYYVAYGGGSSSSHAFASAAARGSVSVRFRGGYRGHGGGHYHH